MYCRYENRGRCELRKKECVPASKGCVIKTVSDVTLIDDTKIYRLRSKEGFFELKLFKDRSSF